MTVYLAIIVTGHMARSEALRDDRRAARARELELIPTLGSTGRSSSGGGEIDTLAILEEEDDMMGGHTNTRRSSRTRASSAGLTSTGQSSKQKGSLTIQRPRYQYLTSVTQMSEELLDAVSVYGFITIAT